MSTNEITKRALMELDLLGMEMWRNNNLAVRGRSFIGRKGVPDLIGYARPLNKRNYAAGVFSVCEVKGEGDRLNKDQLDLLNDAHACGCVVFIATIDERKQFILKDYKPD